MSNNNQQYHGIDEREIKCCDTNPGTIQAGISFDQDDDITILRFHFLQQEENDKLDQVTKSMHLNKSTINQLISELIILSSGIGSELNKTCKNCQNDQYIKRNLFCKYCYDYDHWKLKEDIYLL